MPSLEEIASRDAETYIRQAAQIKQEWFLPRDKKLQDLENERRNKCLNEKLPFFPKFLSDEIRDSLTDECWRLAKKYREEKGTPKKRKSEKEKKTYEFEYFWETSVKTVKKELKCVRARIIHETFRVMVQNKLDILETGDRRSKWRTPSAKLIVDKRCPIFPPCWESTESGLRQKVIFNCRKDGPGIYLPKMYDKMARKGFHGCLICGDFVGEMSGLRCNNCNTRERIVHTKCAAKLGIDDENFRCEKISEHLVPTKLGSGEVRFKNSLEKIETESCYLCVICGRSTGAEVNTEGKSERVFDSDTISCAFVKDSERPCWYRAHHKCWRLHRDIVGGDDIFTCKGVKVQVRGTTVDEVSNLSEHDRKEKLKYLKERGTLQRQRCKRKRRYINAEEKCANCGKIVPLNQKSHLLQHCAGIGATPVIVEDVTDYTALAKRAFAIARRRLDNTSVRLVSNTTPRRQQTAEWGDRPGQSLAELNPRRKRPRLNFQNVSQNN